MNKTKTVLAALLVSAMTVGASSAMANDGDDCHKGKRGENHSQEDRHHGGKHNSEQGERHGSKHHGKRHDGERHSHKGYGNKGDRHGNKQHSGKREGGEQMMRFMAKKLDLTDAQKTQVKALRTAQKTKMEPLREQSRSIRQEMMKLDTASADYITQLTAIADKKANLDRQSFILKGELRQQFNALLTDEQRATMKSMQEKRQERMQARMEKKAEKKAAKAEVKETKTEAAAETETETETKAAE